MKFIYAKDLRKIFKVYGHFYDLKLSNEILKCRSVLEIKRIKQIEKPVKPDIIVIMMNPGSSSPQNENYVPKILSQNEYNKVIEKEIIQAKPDSTQYQIMRLMELNGWNFVRILNLSDLRNGDSGKFRTEFKRATNIDNSNPHCITHINRRRELIESLNSKSQLIIAAWGEIKELKDSAETILKLELNQNIIGRKKKKAPNYYHACPRKTDDRIKWLEEIQEKIKKEN